MKTTRKIFAVVLAVIMVLAMSIPAFAAGTGSITVTNATTGKEYNAYKVFDLTYTGDNVAYTYTKTGATDAFYTALTGAGSPFTLTATTNADVFNVSTTEDAAAISAWLADNESLLGTAAATETATSETVEFTDLDLGYYYVTSELGSVVTLTSAKPSVDVVDKNQKPGPDDTNGYKSIVDEDGNLVDELTADYGQTVTFKLTATATNYDGATKITQYVAHDLPGDGFDDITVTSVEVDGTTLATSAYTLSTTGDEHTITIPWTNASGDFLYTSDGTNSATIVVTVTATVKDSGDKTNKGWFTWTGHEDPDEDEKEEVEVKSFTVTIDKYEEGNTTAKLEGVEFVLTNEEGKFYNLTNGEVTWVDAQADATVVTTDENGAANFAGIKNGTYTVKETKALDGYVLPTTGTNAVISDANATASIANAKGSTTTLPETGGIGTYLFIGIGLIVVLGAGIFLVTNKRMSKENF